MFGRRQQQKPYGICPLRGPRAWHVTKVDGRNRGDPNSLRSIMEDEVINSRTKIQEFTIPSLEVRLVNGSEESE